MKIKNITIFFPDGNKTFYEVGSELLIIKDNKENKTGIKIKSIKFNEKKKESKIMLSNKESFVFYDMPISLTIINT